MLNIKHSVSLFIRSQTAEAVPPLGTVLGNIGVNAVKFCKEFNEFTKELPNYFLLKVKIVVLEDRSYSFSIFLPNTGFFIHLVKEQHIVFIFSRKVKENIISLKNVVQLAKFKFPSIS
jgi:large subunit ribosomal protein L11